MSESVPNKDDEETGNDIDPIHDIIDYLVRCAKISFKNAHVDEAEIRTCHKVERAHELYKQSPSNFLLQFGKYLTPNHLKYFESMQSAITDDGGNFNRCIAQLKLYHSDESKHKRVRNRRYKALQKLIHESDYFCEKQMMFRNPLLYEQLIGQYLTDEEITKRDAVDNENLTFLGMILETVDRNQMRETKNEQTLEEDLETSEIKESDNEDQVRKTHHWGDFIVPDTKPNYMPETRKQSMIDAHERKLLREEFVQEMYSSFMGGRDVEIDYNNIDNNEEYDDLQQMNQDAEDKYFDSEHNDIVTLEEHMKLVEVYGRKTTSDSGTDPLDIFMKHLTNKEL